jgi:hypothetical protein
VRWTQETFLQFNLLMNNYCKTSQGWFLGCGDSVLYKWSLSLERDVGASSLYKYIHKVWALDLVVKV